MADQGWGGEPTHETQVPRPPPTVPFVAPPPPPPPPAYAPPPVYGYQPVYLQPVLPVYADPPKSKIAAGLLALFLGTFGIHNFYLGRIGLGVTQLLLATIGGILTCGIATVCVAIWSFVECIVILCGGINDRHGRPLA